MTLEADGELNENGGFMLNLQNRQLVCQLEHANSRNTSDHPQKVVYSEQDANHVLSLIRRFKCVPLSVS